MTQAELEQFFEDKETPAETAISNEGKDKTSEPYDNTDEIIFAIRQMAALAITHPKSYDILFHLRAMVADLMGVKS